MANEKFFAKKYSTRLMKVLYLSIEGDTSENTTKTTISDQCILVSANFDKVIIDTERKARLIPSELFDVSITMRLTIEVDKKTKIHLQDDEELEKYINGHITSIVEKTSILEKISLIISQLTSVDFTPLITPPSALVDSK